MTETSEIAREHYRAEGLLERVGQALATFGLEATRLTVEQLAGFDQFHTRGLAATAELAEAAGIEPGMAVLDLGSGLGGPARLLAARHGAHVTGIDLSEAFVETAAYLSARCGLADQTRFLTGDASEPPVAATSFDRVFLQHVAMNIADRARLYGAVRRALRPGGRFATYDIVAKEGEVLYPTPWARAAGDSHLLTEAQTSAALAAAGFEIVAWHDDSAEAARWFEQSLAAGPPPGPSLALVLGADFRPMAANLARNIGEGRVGVLSAVLRAA